MTNEAVDVLHIVYILAVEKREDSLVFHVAAKRFRRLKSTEDLRVHLAQARKRRGHRSRSRGSDKPGR